jgi:hypothetical protein
MPKFTARTADKFELYQHAVQSPEAEVRFMDRMYQKLYGRAATRFREDFCGTQLISCEWARLRAENEAWGVDLDQPTLDWGRAHNIARLSAHAAARVHQLHQNVFHVIRPKVEIVGAFNFSYFIFKERRALVTYFKAVRKSLVPQGLFILDCYGGWDAQKVLQEKTRCEGFTYIWDQSAYDPTTDHTLCHIHFKFPDGTMLRKAFTYDWRLWTIGGIRDCLHDAGFTRTQVYWEGTTRQGEGNGVFRPARNAKNEPGWVAYISAVP